MTDTKLVEFFCILDEFSKYFTPELKKVTTQVTPIPLPSSFILQK